MVGVTGPEAWPRRGEPFTVAELDRMPDDGRRYELLDGELLVTARPTTTHQLVVSTATRPFPVEVLPASLVAGIRPSRA